jgi:hypothetical protein
MHANTSAARPDSHSAARRARGGAKTRADLEIADSAQTQHFGARFRVHQEASQRDESISGVSGTQWARFRRWFAADARSAINFIFEFTHAASEKRTFYAGSRASSAPLCDFKLIC